MKLNLLIFILLINIIFTTITEIQKIKVRACMILQSQKYKEEEEKVTHYLEHMSKELKAEPKQILYMSLSVCSKIIPEKLARIIHETSGEAKLNKTNPLVSKIYNFEYYSYDNVEFVKKAYEEFVPVFEVVREEIRNQKRLFNGEFQFEFVHTPLFKLFFVYFIINTIIIFYRRIRYPPVSNIIKEDKQEESHEHHECHHHHEHHEQNEHNKDEEKKGKKKDKKSKKKIE